MNTIKFTLIMLLLAIVASAQTKTCNSPKEDVFEDLMSITKCSIEHSKKDKKTNQLKVRVSANRKRFLVKRTKKRSSVKEANNLETLGLKASSRETLAKKNLLNVTRTLSAEKLKNAEKFITVDEIPSFKKCKSLKNKKRLDCFNQEMISHINKHFYYPAEAVKQEIEGEIWIRFVIDDTGKISNVKTLGNSNTKDLQEVAKYVVSKLPELSPGVKNGKPVPVKYGFPIDFSLQQE